MEILSSNSWSWNEADGVTDVYFFHWRI